MEGNRPDRRLCYADFSLPRRSTRQFCMDSEQISTAEKLQKIRTYLRNLPAGLPYVTDPKKSAYQGITTFFLDPEWVLQEGYEVAFNRSLECALGT
jgi:hypothetical protein